MGRSRERERVKATNDNIKNCHFHFHFFTPSEHKELMEIEIERIKLGFQHEFHYLLATLKILETLQSQYTKLKTQFGDDIDTDKFLQLKDAFDTFSEQLFQADRKLVEFIQSYQSKLHLFDDEFKKHFASQLDGITGREEALAAFYKREEADSSDDNSEAITFKNKA